MPDVNALRTAITALQQHEQDALTRDQALQSTQATQAQQIADLQAQLANQQVPQEILDQVQAIQDTSDKIGVIVSTPVGTPPTDGSTPPADGTAPTA